MLPKASLNSFLCHLLANVLNDYLGPTIFYQVEARNLIEQFPTIRKHIRYLNGLIEKTPVLKKNAISHLNSFPIMEFNYDDRLFQLCFQEFKKNISGI